MKDNYQEITKQIQEKAKALLEDKKVERIIGFKRGEFTGKITPVIITEPEEADGLLFDAECDMILSKYLLDYKGSKSGITAKPCDSRALAVYLAEELVKREDVVVIGINGCQGLENNTACRECTIRNPIVVDQGVGEVSEETIEAEIDEKLVKMSSEEKLAYFQAEFSRCIRCYACREACYVCTCDECFVDSNRPRWVGESIGLRDNMTFHLMRAMHMAGRCVNCGACEQACPEGINMRALTSRLYQVAREVYEYEPGLNTEEKTLFASYKLKDSEQGFLE